MVTRSRTCVGRILAIVAAFCCAESTAASFGLDYRGHVATAGVCTVAAPVAKGAREESLDDGVLRKVEIATEEAPKAPEDLVVGDSLDVSFFDDRTVTLTLRERVPSLDGAASFLATADGYDDMFVAVVVCKDDRIHIDFQDFLSGRVYSVLSSPDRTTVMEIDSLCTPCACAEAPEAPRWPLSSGSRVVSRKEKAARSGMSKGVGEAAFVDILVVYDTLAAEWAKSRGGGVGAFAEIQVQKMNVVLANTDLDQRFRFRLVGAYEVGGSAGGSISRALEAAQSGNVELNGVCWDGVHAKRDETGADIVCVLVDNGLSYGSTGIGYSLLQDSWGFSEYAYNSCLVRAVATGLVMMHEVGHNMGAGHATAVSDEDNRGPQYYTYSAGYYFTGADGERYHTVMAYSSDGYGNYYSPVPFFSSPNHTFKSVPVGDGSHDNSLTMQQTFAATALYRETRIFTVTLGKNGGTGGSSDVVATYGAALPDIIVPENPGWTFAGYWDTVKEGGKQYYNESGKGVRIWDKKGAVTLWAKWTNRVTLGKNGGTGGDNYVTCTKGQPMPTPRTAPKRSGWTFAGYWDTVVSDEGGIPTGRQYYDANMKSVRAWDKKGKATLWAKWTVRVGLGKNGGTGGDDYVTVTFNQPFPKRTMPRRAGYVFGGYWMSSLSKTGPCYNPDGTGTSTMKWMTGGTPTVWALWDK